MIARGNAANSFVTGNAPIFIELFLGFFFFLEDRKFILDEIVVNEIRVFLISITPTYF